MKEQKENKAVNKAKKKTKISMIILFLIASVMFIKGAMLQPQITANLDEIESLEEKIAYEQKRADEVDNMKQNADSDEYIEKMAREKLGMIRKDEIVFIDVSGEE